MTKCRRCNRPLKREPYASLGIGKVCAAKEQAEKRSKGGMGRCKYQMGIDGNIIWLLDLNEGKSLTNDIEFVINDLAKEGYDLSRYIIVYRDSTHIWDGVDVLVLSPNPYETRVEWMPIQTEDYQVAKKLANKCFELHNGYPDKQTLIKYRDEKPEVNNGHIAQLLTPVS